jgi:hypothetical protein
MTSNLGSVIYYSCAHTYRSSNISQKPQLDYALDDTGIRTIYHSLILPILAACAAKLSAMRLTPDLINNSLSYLNPLKERELDLRGAFLERTDTTQ